MRISVKMAFFLPLLTGCMAHYKITPIAPDQVAKTGGLIYYQPKPYLVITNMGLSVTNSAPAGTPTGAPKDKASLAAGSNDAKQVVTAAIIYLPDMEQPRQVEVTKSIGTFKSTISLTNGWMLTGLNSEADAKFAETVTAFSGLLTSATKAGGLPFTDSKAGDVAQPFFYLLRMDLTERKLVSIAPGCLAGLLTQGKPCD